MKLLNYPEIIREAWQNFDSQRKIVSIEDVSVMVSTNHVYRIWFQKSKPVFAKLSYYGRYEHFVEDHTIINILASILPSPYRNLLARSLMKNRKVYTYRYKTLGTDVWVVFYLAVEIRDRLPKRLNESLIVKMGVELAKFHLACTKVKDQLPRSSKTLYTDVDILVQYLQKPEGQFEHGINKTVINEHCRIFINSLQNLNYSSFVEIPVFVDWNIGNFSIKNDGSFYSRWDYDWFRISSRVLDFYFFSRVVSDLGDRTVFSYLINTLMEERFLLFLKSYHQIFPLTKNEILFLKEAYRFFILNYVIKDGNYFFHQFYATRLQREAYEIYLPQINETFFPEKIIESLQIS